ncbi:MAG: AAA family ATPase [Janibacter sp.]|nr:AAA family ATPase [Janibacter sp.]
MPTPAPSLLHGRVVVLAGPSGSGKSRLAGRLQRAHGWPVVRLDDFYKDADASDLPVSAELGMVDWDDPASWDEQAAVTALRTLLTTGEASMPVYDISVSRAVGEHTITARPDDLVIAEGIFAAEAIPALRTAGLLHSAWCIRHHRLKTFVLRLVRDLKERRKPPLTLVRRGLVLMRDEPQVVARHEELGARCATPTRAERELSGA